VKQRAVTLDAQLQKFTAQRDRFKLVVAGFKKLTEESADKRGEK
jgi:hypothetical protein